MPETPQVATETVTIAEVKDVYARMWDAMQQGEKRQEEESPEQVSPIGDTLEKEEGSVSSEEFFKDIMTGMEELKEIIAETPAPINSMLFFGTCECGRRLYQTPGNPLITCNCGYRAYQFSPETTPAS